MDAEEVIRELFAAYNEGDIDRATALVTDDFKLVDIPAGVTLDGPEGLRAWLEGFKSSMPDSWTDVKRIIVQGDWAASVHVGGGTNTGPLHTPTGELPPTGRSVEIEIAEVYRLSDGKLAELRAYYDGASMMQQLGLMPETAAVE
jgi:steroid delta-isomerase-like uncharacterized protein